MRPLPIGLALLLLATPAVWAGASGCYAIPPGSLAGVGSCSVSFTTGPGLVQAQVEVLFGSVGEVVIRGDGPGSGDLVATCTLGYSAGACSPVFGVFGPSAGAWTWSAQATNANVGGADARVWFVVTYP